MKKLALGTGAGATIMALVMGAVIPNIEQSEGTKYQAYHDVAKVLTVCSGHTGKDVVVGKVYTPSECSALTLQDAQKASAGVLAVSPHLIYHPYQLAAAISFTYNLGNATYAKSSIATNFNKGDFVAGCNALLLYKYADGKIVQGLLDRRVREQAICMSTLTPKGYRDYVGVGP